MQSFSHGLSVWGVGLGTSDLAAKGLGVAS